MFLRQWFTDLPIAETLLFCLSGGLIAMFTQKSLYHPEKGSLPSTLRNLILLEMGIYLIYTFLLQPGFPPDFKEISPGLIINLLLPLLTWLMTSFFYSSFLFREHFYASLLRKENNNIKENLRNLGYYLKGSLKKIDSMQKAVIFIMLLTGLFCFINYLLLQNITLLAIILIFIHYFVLLYWNFKLKISYENDILLGEGLIMEHSRRSGEGKIYLLLTSVAASAGLLLSGSRAIFPWQWLQSLIQKLISMIKFKTVNLDYDSMNLNFETLTPPASDQGPLPFIQEPGKEPYRLPEEVKRIALLVLLSLLALAFLYYLIYPLLKRKRGPGLHSDKSIKNWLRKVLEDLQIWIKELRKPRRDKDTLRMVWNDEKNTFTSEKKGNNKKSDDDIKIKKTMVRHFLRLTRWGRRQGIPFQKGLGPEEYCRKLADHFKERKTEFNEQGMLFQEYFYSPGAPDKEQLNRLNLWLKELEKRRKR